MSSCARTDCRPTLRASGSSCLRAQDEDRGLQGPRHAGQVPGRPGVARIVDEALAAADTRGRLHIGGGVGARNPRARRRRREGSPLQCAGWRRRAGQEARPRHLPAGAGATGADPHETVVIEDSRNGPRAAAAGLLLRHRQQLHGCRGLLGGRARVYRASATWANRPGPRQSKPRRTWATSHWTTFRRACVLAQGRS